MAHGEPAGAALPASNYDFVDATDVFRQAASEMDPSDVYFMEGFGLLEAMSAIEIGEPRLDTGFIKDNEILVPFDPLTPMLPEEICWILDRACACEMEWHSGRLLSHTVFTLIYIHELRNIETDLTPGTSVLPDPLRPIQLITMVLRPAVQGLLKCCDLAWRELSTGGMLDAEDWQSDKCEVSLLEGLPTAAVHSRLNEAVSWIMRTNKIPERWKHPLRARILLRKSLLQLVEHNSSADPAQLANLIGEARECLTFVQSNPVPDPTPDSPALRAFDPTIIRRLSTAVPACRVAEPSIEQAWEALAALLDDLYDLSCLKRTRSFISWEIAGNLRTWSPGRRRAPYARSLIQKTFYNGVLVLHHFPFKWLLDRFFSESLCINYEAILKSISNSWNKAEPPPVQNLERILFTLLSPHIRNHWCNGPRRRRYLTKSLINWHKLYDLFLDVVGGLNPSNRPRDDGVRYLPAIALLWRLSVVQEVVFSGFQLNLYSPEEIPFTYWYATHVIEARLECLDHVIKIIPKSSLTYHEYEFQREFLTALQLMAMGIFMVSLPMMSCDWDATRPNFYRRYKWAYKTEYDGIKAVPIASPNFRKFVRICEDIARDETLDISPANMIELARVILNKSLQSASLGGWAESWTNDRVQFIQRTVMACEALGGIPASLDEMGLFNIGLLKWDPEVHPWFPSLTDEGAERRRRGYLCHLHH